MKKRPRDPAQLAKFIVDGATGEIKDREPDSGKDPAAQALGRKGGQARAKNMLAKQRAEIAKRAAQKWWGQE